MFYLLVANLLSGVKKQLNIQIPQTFSFLLLKHVTACVANPRSVLTPLLFSMPVLGIPVKLQIAHQHCGTFCLRQKMLYFEAEKQICFQQTDI